MGKNDEPKRFGPNQDPKGTALGFKLRSPLVAYAMEHWTLEEESLKAYLLSDDPNAPLPKVLKYEK